MFPSSATVALIPVDAPSRGVVAMPMAWVLPAGGAALATLTAGRLKAAVDWPRYTSSMVACSAAALFFWTQRYQDNLNVRRLIF